MVYSPFAKGNKPVDVRDIPWTLDSQRVRMVGPGEETSGPPRFASMHASEGFRLAFGANLLATIESADWQECVEHRIRQGHKFDPIDSLPGFWEDA